MRGENASTIVMRKGINTNAMTNCDCVNKERNTTITIMLARKTQAAVPPDPEEHIVFSPGRHGKPAIDTLKITYIATILEKQFHNMGGSRWWDIRPAI